MLDFPMQQFLEMESPMNLDFLVVLVWSRHMAVSIEMIEMISEY